MPTAWDIGERARLTYTLRDVDNALANGTVTLTVTAPDGTQSTPAVTNVSTGIYRADVDLDQAGRWVYRWASTGAVINAEDGYLVVEPNIAATMYASVDDLKTRFPHAATDTADDARFELALIAASRAIDEHCGRRFYADTAATARTYRPEDPYVLVVDDISTATGVVVKTDTADNGTYDTTLAVTTDYITEPPNALAQSRPLRRIVYLTGAFPTAGHRPRVQVTAKWGWPAVPAQVRDACLIKAARLFRRADSPEGVAGVGDFGVVRISRYEDPDVSMLLAPFDIGPLP